MFCFGVLGVTKRADVSAHHKYLGSCIQAG